MIAISEMYIFSGGKCIIITTMVTNVIIARHRLVKFRQSCGLGTDCSPKVEYDLI